MKFTSLSLVLFFAASFLGYAQTTNSNSFPPTANQGKGGYYCKKCYKTDNVPVPNILCRSAANGKEQGTHQWEKCGYLQCSKCKFVLADDNLESSHAKIYSAPVRQGCPKSGQCSWQKAPGMSCPQAQEMRKNLVKGNASSNNTNNVAN
jgi:hypothetical protein